MEGNRTGPTEHKSLFLCTLTPLDPPPPPSPFYTTTRQFTSQWPKNSTAAIASPSHQPRTQGWGEGGQATS